MDGTQYTGRSAVANLFESHTLKLVNIDESTFQNKTEMYKLKMDF